MPAGRSPTCASGGGGQRNIKLLDPNITACPDWRDLFGQLKESGACVDFTQGIDIRLLTDEKVEALNGMKVKMLHFAWDGNDDLLPLFKRFAEPFAPLIKRRMVRVYVLCNFNTTMEWNLHRIESLRAIGYDPYVMIYDKPHASRRLRKLQRYVNNKFIFRATTWKDYDQRIG